MKTCIHCKIEKQETEFRPNGRGCGSTRNDCKACERLRSANTPVEKQTAATRRWRDNRPGYRKAYLRDNPVQRSKELAGARAYKKNNSAKILAINARRKACKLQATPAWANEFYIREIYEIAVRRTVSTGVAWQVDHVVPLKSPLVCGLHVEDNLQVITAKANQSKKNYYWPDMPEARARCQPHSLTD